MPPVAPPSDVLFMQYLIAVWHDGIDGSQQDVPVWAETTEQNAAAITNRNRILYYEADIKLNTFCSTTNIVIG